MKKIGGYIISLIGFLVLASGISQINEKAVEFLPFLKGIQTLYLIIAGIVLIVIGLIVVKSSPSEGKQAEEVPIYRGKRVVGYRRN